MIWGWWIPSLLVLNVQTSSALYDLEALPAVPYVQLPIRGVNETQTFYNHFNNKEFKLSESKLNQLRSLEIIIVPGFLREWVENWRGYFDPLRDWLRGHGVSYTSIETMSDTTSSENSKKIIEAIKTSSKKVLIVAHSRGGLETLEALIENEKLQSKVSGIVFVQSPFYGTWISDAVYEWCGLGKNPKATDQDVQERSIDCLDKIFNSRFMNGNFKDFLEHLWSTIKEMRSKPRQDWMKKNEEKIFKIFEVKKIPTLALTSQDPGLSLRWTFYEPFRQLMWRAHIPNDGVVPQSSMALPRAARIDLIEPVDHSDLFSPIEKRIEYQKRVFAVTAHMILQ